jgi:hypothetical protein
MSDSFQDWMLLRVGARVLCVCVCVCVEIARAWCVSDWRGAAWCLQARVVDPAAKQQGTRNAHSHSHTHTHT